MSPTIETGPDCLRVVGDMTLDGAASLLEQGRQASASSARVFDLSGVGEIDSSGLAVLFGWLRSAESQGQALRIVNPPSNLINLAEVYGVTDLLSLPQV